MKNGIGVLLNLTLEEANNLMALLNRVQISGAEALAVVIIRQNIEAAIREYQQRQVPTEPEPAEASE